MTRWQLVVRVLALLAAVFMGGRASAEVLAVPDSVRHMREPQEELHVLRTVADGTPLGEQRFHAEVEHDQLLLRIDTRFTNGEEWQEHAVMDLEHGYRAVSFDKVARKGGKVLVDEAIDFRTGRVRWLDNGVQREKTFTFTPDTYMGPMLGVVLADVPGRPHGQASFQALVFRPAPDVYTMRADVLGQEDFRLGATTEPTTKIRLKADLGPVQNALFANLIPTHIFWFTRENTPEFFAFEGSLGSVGTELRMVPARPPVRTAQVEARQ